MGFTIPVHLELVTAIGVQLQHGTFEVKIRTVNSQLREYRCIDRSLGVYSAQKGELSHRLGIGFAWTPYVQIHVYIY